MSSGNRWQHLKTASAEQYDARFAAMASAGADVHGEAAFLTTVTAPPARVIDAGCGTGRVAVRLADLGYECVAIDADLDMLGRAVAVPTVRWVHGDLADDSTWRPIGPEADNGAGSAGPGRATRSEPVPKWVHGGADLVVLAGNVIALLAPATLTTCMKILAATLRPGGALVAGFGLDAAHLPPGCPPTTVSDFDAAAAAAGLQLRSRCSSWSGEAWDEGAGGYALSVLAN